MTQFDYSDNIPFDTNDPSVDQPNMKTNTNSIDNLINVDHVSFNFPNGGYHRIIHQINNNASPRTRSGVGATYANFPAAIPTINQVFQALYTPDTTAAVADTQLFNITGIGGISQLTGNLATTDGWCWVGGILIQWGFVSITLPAGTVTFKDRVTGAIPFPNNIFNIQATFTRKSSSSPSGAATIWIRKNSNPEPDITEFTWNISGSSGASTPDGFYWTAIGN